MVSKSESHLSLLLSKSDSVMVNALLAVGTPTSLQPEEIEGKTTSHSCCHRSLTARSGLDHNHKPLFFFTLSTPPALCTYSMVLGFLSPLCCTCLGQLSCLCFQGLGGQRAGWEF